MNKKIIVTDDNHEQLMFEATQLGEDLAQQNELPEWHTADVASVARLAATCDYKFRLARKLRTTVQRFRRMAMMAALQKINEILREGRDILSLDDGREEVRKAVRELYGDD